MLQADSVCVAIAMASMLRAITSTGERVVRQHHGGCCAIQVSFVESPGAPPSILWSSIYALLWTMDDHRATAGSGDMRSSSLTVSCATLKCERCIICHPSAIVDRLDICRYIFSCSYRAMSSGLLLLTIE